MVTADAVRRGLGLSKHDLRVEWVERAGHVGFPPKISFTDAPPGLDQQVIGWLLGHG